MLFWIFVILIVIGVIVLFKFDEFEFIGGIMMAIGVFGFLISLAVLIISYAGIDGKVERLHTRYETLVYQYENDIYDNDNDLGKRELMEDIRTWNEDLSAKQANQNDFWIGIFIPDIYDQFEYIELKRKGEKYESRKLVRTRYSFCRD